MLALGGGKNGRQAVIVAGRNRIELVIVTTRAAGRQAEQAGADGRNHIVQLVVAVLLALGGRSLAGDGQQNGRAGCQKTGRRLGRRIVRGQFVAGQLPLDEAVERHVIVERGDHEVAIVIQVQPVLIGLVAGAVGVAGDVEPVAAPALAIAGASQKPIDQPLIRIGRTVGAKFGHFAGRGG